MGGRGRADVIPVGQELLTSAPVLDADDACLGQLAHGSVDGVDRAAKAPGQGLAGRHPATGAVPVAKQKRVQAERTIGDGRVDHPLGHDREPRLLNDKSAGGVLGFGRWGFSGHDMAFRTDAGRWAWLNRPLALKGQRVRNASGNAPELHGLAGSSGPSRHVGQA
jgi:hypothetical protein